MNKQERWSKQWKQSRLTRMPAGREALVLVIEGNVPGKFIHQDAKSLLGRVGLSTDLGTRPIWSKWMNLLLLLDDVRFYVQGYTTRLGRRM
jgi:hypothetical protein